MSEATKPTATVLRSTVKKTYHLILEGCEPRPVHKWNPDRLYRPTRMTVVVQNGNVSDVEMHGPVAKKDGSDGKQGATERLWMRDDWPSWVKSIVGGLA